MAVSKQTKSACSEAGKRSIDNRARRSSACIGMAAFRNRGCEITVLILDPPLNPDPTPRKRGWRGASRRWTGQANAWSPR
jgi:hypothetical protein